MLWLYLNFSNLQLDGLYHKAEQPVIIVCSQSNRVVQLNEAAKNIGINMSMGLATAAALCQHLSVVPYQENSEKKRLLEIASQLYDITADIALDLPNGLFLRVGNMLTLYNNINNYWQHINKQLSSESLHYHYACAYSPFAAKLLAQSQLDQCWQDKNKIHQALNNIPTAQLKVSNKNLDNMQRIGIRKLAQLFELPLKDIGQRFDIDLVNEIGRITGELKHGLQFYQPELVLTKHIELCYEISRSEILKHPLKQLLIYLESFLYRRNLLTPCIRFKLHQRHGEPLELVVQSAEAQYKAKKWQELILLKLASLTLSAPIIAIDMLVDRFLSKQDKTKDLFSNTQSSFNKNELVSLLEAKLGENQVFSMQAIDEHRPEYVTQMLSPLIPKTATPPASTIPLRPSYILSKPAQLNSNVDVILGPERIQSSWWLKQPVWRDYFIGRTSQGQWCWLYRQPDNRWFIQGYFG